MAFQVEFVSPEDSLYSGQATQVVARTKGGGEIAFLEGHEPFVGSLDTCEVRVTEESGSVVKFAVRGGFVSVAGKKVTVLSNGAIPANDIDVSVAREQLTTAEAALTSDSEDDGAKADKKWAQVQLTTAGVDV